MGWEVRERTPQKAHRSPWLHGIAARLKKLPQNLDLDV